MREEGKAGGPTYTGGTTPPATTHPHPSAIHTTVIASVKDPTPWNILKPQAVCAFWKFLKKVLHTPNGVSGKEGQPGLAGPLWPFTPVGPPPHPLPPSPHTPLVSPPPR